MGGYANIVKKVVVSAARSTAKLMKTGQTTSYRTGDDGDLERGREVNNLTLAENNIFGNLYRFTGITGGYFDGTNWKNAAGVTVLEAVAIPEDIVIDNALYDEKTKTVLGYTRNVDALGSVINWDTAVDNCLAYATTTYNSGWAIVNKLEVENLINSGTTGGGLNFPPFNYATAVSIWTGTTDSTNTANAFRWNLALRQTSSLGKTSATGMRAMAVRVFTVTGTTLS